MVNRIFFKELVSWTAWPALVIICVSISIIGFSAGHPVIGITAYVTPVQSEGYGR